MFPVELIDRPCRHAGLLQRPHVRGVGAPQLFGERVSSRREFVQRQLVKTIDFVIEASPARPWRMVSSTAAPSSSILRAPIP